MQAPAASPAVTKPMDYVSADITHAGNVIRPEPEFGHDAGQTIKKVIGIGITILVILIIIGAISGGEHSASQSTTADDTSAAVPASEADQNDNAAAPAADAQVPAPDSAQNAGSTASATAAQFATDYLARSGSDSGTPAIELVNSAYADQVNYFGKMVSKADVAIDKARYEMRWPVRSYGIEDNSMSAACADDQTACTVSGTLRYDVSSPERGAHGTGRSSFEFELAMTPDGPRIIAETSNVIQ